MGSMRLVIFTLKKTLSHATWLSPAGCGTFYGYVYRRWWYLLAAGFMQAHVHTHLGSYPPRHFIHDTTSIYTFFVMTYLYIVSGISQGN